MNEYSHVPVNIYKSRWQGGFGSQAVVCQPMRKHTGWILNMGVRGGGTIS